MSEILEPCPYCEDNGAPLVRGNDADENWCVECCECYRDSTPDFKTRAEAVAYWKGFSKGVRSGKDAR